MSSPPRVTFQHGLGPSECPMSSKHVERVKCATCDRLFCKECGVLEEGEACLECATPECTVLPPTMDSGWVRVIVAAEANKQLADAAAGVEDMMEDGTFDDVDDYIVAETAIHMLKGFAAATKKLANVFDSGVPAPRAFLDLGPTVRLMRQRNNEHAALPPAPVLEFGSPAQRKAPRGKPSTHKKSAPAPRRDLEKEAMGLATQLGLGSENVALLPVKDH